MCLSAEEARREFAEQELKIAQRVIEQLTVDYSEVKDELNILRDKYERLYHRYKRRRRRFRDLRTRYETLMNVHLRTSEMHLRRASYSEASLTI